MKNALKKFQISLSRHDYGLHKILEMQDDYGNNETYLKADLVRFRTMEYDPNFNYQNWLSEQLQEMKNLIKELNEQGFDDSCGGSVDICIRFWLANDKERWFPLNIGDTMYIDKILEFINRLYSENVKEG